MTRRMIVPLLFGLIGAAILIGLGSWQMQRLEWKRSILAEADARISDAPLPLPAAPDPVTDRYMPVVIAGRFTGEEAHVLTSKRDRGPGFLVIAAFETSEGRRVMVDRGFVPEAAKTTPRAPQAAEVTGNLHWPDDVNASTPPYDAGRAIWYGRDVTGMAELLGTEPVLVIARGDTGDGITAQPVDTSAIKNDHLEYAITWFSLAVVWLGMTALYLWRIRQRTE